MAISDLRYKPQTIQNLQKTCRSNDKFGELTTLWEKLTAVHY